MMLHVRIGLLSLIAAFLVWRSSAQSTFQTSVSLVHVDTEVLDRNHRVLTGLRKEDFIVHDNEVEQPVLSLAAEEQPIDLVLLFDTSRSMRGVIKLIAESADRAFAELHSGDRVSVMVFNSQSATLIPLTTDLATARTVVRDALVETQFGSSTSIQSAVADAGHTFAPEQNAARRRAILIVTDDIGIRTRREDSVARELWDVDASLNGVIVRDKAFATELRVAHVLSPGTLLMQAGMKGIAEKTGGDVLQSTEAGAAFGEMMHRIRSRYSVYYRMPHARRGEIRRISVELSPAALKRFPDATLRARKGYVVH